MEPKSILQFLDNKIVLVTGGTGFLAKVLVEKILRVQPNVKKLYLLIRANDQEEAFKRFQTDIVGKNLFRILKETHGRNLQTFLSEKVTPVAGDIAYENMGVRDSNLIEEMQRYVDVVVNAAATTNFYERYDVALGINTLGAKYISDFVMTCVRLQLLLHVSTAYVSGEKEGLILEKQYILGENLDGKTKLDIDEEKKVIDGSLKQLMTDKATDKAIAYAMKDLGIKRAKHHGWPNTYVFTKAMGEMLLGEYLRKDVPLLIVRPTVVSSSYKEPFPGWVEGIRTVDSLCAAYCKGMISCFPGDPDCILDMIPVDMVVNAMIVAMAAHVHETNFKIIYHLGSSASNPIRLTQIMDWGIQYFAKFPYINDKGIPIKAAGKFKLMTSPRSFKKYMTRQYGLPLKGLKIANMVLCNAFNGFYTKGSRNLRRALLLADLYRPYCFLKIIFDDTNLKNLLKTCKENAEVETEIFFFDSMSINWKDYLMNTHLPGLVKYAIK